MSYYADIEEVEVLEEVDLEAELGEIGLDHVSYLIVYNDDENSFEWVIESFMDVLKYAAEQAEQLAIIIHHKGKATVKTASFAVLKPMKDALCDRGLSAVIEGGNEDD